MEPILNEQQTQMRESAMRLCKNFAGPARLRALHKAGAATDATAWQQLVDAGWPQLMVPEANDGLGMGLLELALMMDECGQNLMQVPVLQAVAAHYAQGVALASDGTAVVVPVLVDEGDAYNEGARLLSAKKAAGGWSIIGHVPAVVAADAAQVFIVPARDEGDQFLLVTVQAGVKGVALKPQATIDGSRADALTLDSAQCQVLAEGDAADAMYADLATLLRVGTAAELIGVATRSLAMTLEHLKTRKQFGKLLGSFQALQHACVNAFLDIELNRSLLYRTAAAWDKGQAHPAMVSALKARASRAALAGTRLAVQMHGAMGYTEAHDIGLYYKRAVVLAAQYGNENHHAARFSELTLAKAAA